MKRYFLFLFLSFLVIAQACKNENNSAVKVISPQEVYDAVYNSDTSVQVVDVRTPKEFGVSHLKNAQNICVTNRDFKEKVKTLDKNKPVYVYCKKGVRSAKAAKILTDMGFTEVYDLHGGTDNWKNKGLQLEK